MNNQNTDRSQKNMSEGSAGGKSQSWDSNKKSDQQSEGVKTPGGYDDTEKLPPDPQGFKKETTRTGVY